MGPTILMNMLELRGAGRVLLVGPGLEPVGRALAGPGAELRAIASASELEGAAGPWDAVVLVGALERERWDRWLVQRVHRALAPGGSLVVRVPNLLDVWTAGGVG